MPEVTELVEVATAYVPCMKMKFDGVEIDLLYCQLATNIVPKKLDLSDDTLVSQLDDKSILSFNGPRVVHSLLSLVPNVETFRTSLRAIKHWAQSRGVYGNATGYPGGVAWAIMTARVCQLFPNAAPSVLVNKFFVWYAKWQWPKPILLKPLKDERNPTHMKDGVGAKEIWDPAVHVKHQKGVYK